jgi:DNA-binding beta-propeller fold protein YncE
VKRILFLVLAAASLVGAPTARAAEKKAPLTLVQTFPLPATVKGGLAHFGIDVEGHRLFLPAEDAHAVLVLDLQTGSLVHTIDGLGRPRAALYRPDLGSLYIVDGESGEVKVYDAATYRLVRAANRTAHMMPNADSIGYDPETKFLYVDSAGPDPNKKSSLFNFVDTSSGYKGTDMELDGNRLQGMALEMEGPLIYLNNTAKHEIDVIDRKEWTLVAKWPVTMGQENVAMALDEAAHRLFVGCRNGDIVVFNTETGEEVKALPIAAGVSDLAFDPLTRRIYAACASGDGAVEVYQENDGDRFEKVGRVTSGPDAGDGELVADIHRYFISVPAHGKEPAKILVYQIQ